MNPFAKEGLDRLLRDLSNPTCRAYTLPLGRGYLAEDTKRGIVILDLSIETHRIVYEIAKVYKVEEESQKRKKAVASNDIS